MIDSISLVRNPRLISEIGGGLPSDLTFGVFFVPVYLKNFITVPFYLAGNSVGSGIMLK